jgi:toxin ParE1/3/4
MKPVEVHPDAESDADKAFVWYWERSERAASGFDSELRAAFSALRKTPKIGAPYLCGTRKTTLNRYPYIVIFRELPRKIQIIAVAHAKRRPDFWTSRL